MYEGSSDYQLVSTFMQTVVFGREIVVYENEGKVLWIMNVTTRTVKSWDPNRIPIRSHWTRKVLWLITVSESDVFLMFLNICMTTTVMHMTTTLNRPSVWFVSDIPRVEDDVSRFFEMYLKTSTMKRTEVREENTFFVNEVIGENYNQRDSILLRSLPCWMQWLTIIQYKKWEFQSSMLQSTNHYQHGPIVYDTNKDGDWSGESHQNHRLTTYQSPEYISDSRTQKCFNGTHIVVWILA